MRRPDGVEHRVEDLLAAPGQRLLKLGLEIDVTGGRVLDATIEGRHDRLLDRLEAVLEEERRQRRLEQSGEDIPVLGQPLELLLRDGAAVLEQLLAQTELARHLGAAGARDDVRADLGHPSLR